MTAHPLAPSRPRAAAPILLSPLLLALVLSLTFVLTLTGCSDDGFDPITRITAPRVLALLSEPTVLPVDGDVRLEAITVDPLGPRGGPRSAPDARPVTAVRMRACTPWKLFADPALDCSGADSLDLALVPTSDPDDPGDPGDPDGEGGRFLMPTAALLAAFPPPQLGGSRPATADDLRTALAAGLDLRIPVIAEVEVDGETLIARRDIRIAEAVGDLQNPRITEARFDGVATTTLRAGQRYTLTVAFDRTSLDPSDDDDGRPGNGRPGALEEIDCNLYSPTGELAEREVDVERPDASDPVTERNAYTAGTSGPTWLYLVATDETGGMGFSAIPLTILD